MQVSQYTKNWPIITGLLFASIPIIIMYLYLIIDTFTDAAPGEIFPNRFTLEHWRFLWEDIEGKVNIWVAMFNTFIFALSVRNLILVMMIYIYL